MKGKLTGALPHISFHPLTSVALASLVFITMAHFTFLRLLAMGELVGLDITFTLLLLHFVNKSYRTACLSSNFYIFTAVTHMTATQTANRVCIVYITQPSFGPHLCSGHSLLYDFLLTVVAITAHYHHHCYSPRVPMAMRDLRENSIMSPVGLDTV